MSYEVYILQSLKTGRYYTGSAENELKRLKQHNSGKVRATKPYRPWVIVHTEEFLTRGEAYKREMRIKKYKNGEAFQKLISRSNNGQVPK